jgi:hypothetical protein
MNLGHDAQLLGEGRVVALLLEDVGQLLERLEVVREAPEHRLELVARLVAQAVLAEDAALGEVLGDELLVVGRERPRELDARRSRGRAGRDRRRPRCRLEVDLGCLPTTPFAAASSCGAVAGG